MKNLSAQLLCTAAAVALASGAASAQDRAGSVRGVAFDKDFDAPLGGVTILIVETGQKLVASEQGNYVFPEVAPGKYTLVFSKDGYVRQVKADVLVLPGQLTDLDAYLSGEFTEMEEFVVEDVLEMDTGTEAGLLELRFETPALMDSISVGLMSRAGASDAASALRLVSGATVQDGKFAVIRGLPDRYVSSQMNGVRLPSADEDKRAVELDQFPTSVIESIQVSKTFTPDQQGDASGGAVDVRLRGIPEETTLNISGQLGYNSNVTGRSDFLSYDGGGVEFFGYDDGGRDPQDSLLGQSWKGAVGVREEDAPIDSKWSISGGGMRELANGWRMGSFGSFFYERDSQYIDDGTDDSWWVTTPGTGMTPQTYQGTPTDGDFKTGLFDIDQSSLNVRWGALGVFGVENDKNKLSLTYLYTHTAEDTATLAIDTRGKEYFFPGHDPNDTSSPGTDAASLNAAPYLRTETLEYTERTTSTLQLRGEHDLPAPGDAAGIFKEPKLDWTLSASSASMDQPDKRQFGALWQPSSFNPGFPPFIPPFTTPATWLPYKPAANFNLGNVQRIWKTIEEDNSQLAANLKLPFEQWSGQEGYAKLGVFSDRVDRKFTQDTYTNSGDFSTYQGDFDDPWSAQFPSENHPMFESLEDVDYDGEQNIDAVYGMVDLPFSPVFKAVGGARFESTEIGIVNDPDALALWYPPGAAAPTQLNPGDADVDFSQTNVLPSLGLEYKPAEKWTMRAAWSQTLARQTFKELTPIIQSEFLGGPIFIGNPDLQMSELQNYDLRVDYTPYDGGLVSVSGFHKDLTDPIEYVQRIAGFNYTTAINYPEGRLSGAEVELRQDLSKWNDSLTGFSLGANATFIDSQVSLTQAEIDQFNQPNIAAPMSTRDMTNAPEQLFNLFLTWDNEESGTQVGLFYTIQGDTLIAGAGESNGNYIPNVYAVQYDTLNLSVFQRIGEHMRLQLQAKNLTDPTIETVYRSKYIGDDVRRTSFTRGIDVTLTLNLSYSF